ncbi:MAG: hypothetical protein K6F30_09760 [Lachnospiraceae bacterium]|nr:hypothetical protein [Lachnospiraceae bacterium]
MKFDEMGNMSGKNLMLLPGTCCDYQTNFGSVLDDLGKKYHLICVNYDGFDGTGGIFTILIYVNLICNMSSGFSEEKSSRGQCLEQ